MGKRACAFLDFGFGSNTADCGSRSKNARFPAAKYLFRPLNKMSLPTSPHFHTHTHPTLLALAAMSAHSAMMSLTARPVMAGKRVASNAVRCEPDTFVIRAFSVRALFSAHPSRKARRVAGKRDSPTRERAPSRDDGDHAIAYHAARVLALGTRSRRSRVHHASSATFRRRRLGNSSAPLSRVRSRDAFRRGGRQSRPGVDVSPATRFGVFFHFFTRRSPLNVVFSDRPLALSHSR